MYSKNIAIGCCFFNPTNSENRIKNLKCFLNFLDNGGIGEHVYICEVLFGNQKSVLENRKNVIKVNTKSILWHKESAHNIILKCLPEGYKKIIFSDTDILWKNLYWWKDVEMMLDKVKMVQCFDKLYHLCVPEVSIEDFENECVYFSHDTISYTKAFFTNKKIGQTGICWGYSIDVLNKLGGFYDKMLVGGGDTINLPFIYREEFFSIYKGLGKELMEYKLKLLNIIDDSVDYLKMPCYHLYHGIPEDRQYETRHKLIAGLNFKDCFTKNECNLYKCEDDKIQSDINEFFKDRNDDSLSPEIEYRVGFVESEKYTIEYFGGRPFIWLPNEFKMGLIQVSKIKIEFMNLGNVNCANEFDIEINDFIKNVNLDESKIVELDLDSNIPSIVKFKPNRFFVPSELSKKSSDDRKLSIALVEIKITFKDGNEKLLPLKYINNMSEEIFKKRIENLNLIKT